MKDAEKPVMIKEMLPDGKAKVNLKVEKVHAVIGLVDAGTTGKVAGYDSPVIEVMGDMIVLKLSNSGRESAGGPWSWTQELVINKNNPSEGHYEIRRSGANQLRDMKKMEQYRQNPGSADVAADNMLTRFAKVASRDTK